jgi:hypothetical protein
MRRPEMSVVLRTKTQTRFFTSAATVPLKLFTLLRVCLIRPGVALRGLVVLCPKISLQCRSSLILIFHAVRLLLQRKHQTSKRASKHDSATAPRGHLPASTVSQCRRRSNSSLRNRPPGVCLAFRKRPSRCRRHRTIRTQPTRSKNGESGPQAQCGRHAMA